jgi:hypothetical protein
VADEEVVAHPRCQSGAHAWEEEESAQRCCHPDWERTIADHYGRPRWKFVATEEQTLDECNIAY